MGVLLHFRRLFWPNTEIRGHGLHFLGLGWLAVVAELSRRFIAESPWLYDTTAVASRTTVWFHLSRFSGNVIYCQQNGARHINWTHIFFREILFLTRFGSDQKVKEWPFPIIFLRPDQSTNSSNFYFVCAWCWTEVPQSNTCEPTVRRITDVHTL